MQLSIRPIRETDYRDVAIIWSDVLDIPTTEQELAAFYAQVGGDDRYQTFVAEADGKVIGLITTVSALAIGHPNGYTKINGLGVLPDYRRMGVGKALILRAEQESRENGTYYLGLATGLTRHDAHAFYENMGFRKTSYWFRKRVPEA